LAIEEQPLDLAGLRAFVVEDEALVLLTLEDMLAEVGCRVVVASQHVDEALRLAVDAAVDVALLDVNVGGTRIDPVAQVLAARNIPIVFVTGYEAPTLPEGLGRVTRVGKPFQAGELVAGLRRVLSLEDTPP
jgi:CheY-like chemotaxis protein